MLLEDLSHRHAAGPHANHAGTGGRKSRMQGWPLMRAGSEVMHSKPMVSSASPQVTPKSIPDDLRTRPALLLGPVTQGLAELGVQADRFD
jgi:hypothetical protein